MHSLIIKFFVYLYIHIFLSPIDKWWRVVAFIFYYWHITVVINGKFDESLNECWKQLRIWWRSAENMGWKAPSQFMCLNRHLVLRLACWNSRLRLCAQGSGHAEAETSQSTTCSRCYSYSMLMVSIFIIAIIKSKNLINFYLTFSQ